jgi:EpsI family protein
VTQSSRTFALATLLIAAAIVFLRVWPPTEVAAARSRLTSFPEKLGAWTGTDQTLPDDELAVLGTGEFLKRDYSNLESPQPDINLFIAYYPSQGTNDTPHSPQNCLPGSGWTPVENKRITLAFPGHAPFPANRYLITLGDTKGVVLYWFWAHDRGIASEFYFKYYLVRDSLTMHRSDGALIRLVTLMQPGEDADDAERRLLPFAGEVMPLMNRYIPR